MSWERPPWCWGKRWTGYVLDQAFDGGVALNGYDPFWCLPVKFWWQHPIKFSRWRIDFDFWPLHFSVATWRSDRYWRGLTVTQIKWRVREALDELARDKPAGQ